MAVVGGPYSNSPVNLATAPPSRPLDDAVSGLERIVSVLMEGWQTMRNRLEPITSGSERPATPRDLRPTVGDSPITMRIRNEASRVDAVVDDMLNLLERLEV